jgi:DnaJ-class molecular chaperone
MKLPSAVRMLYDPLRYKVKDIGHEKCENCNGWGNISPKGCETRAIPGKDYSIKTCSVCGGKGYVTWLEKVFGVER